jgi:hypothetical protein
MTAPPLSAYREAASAVSSGGKARFTPRNLYYEMVRRQSLPPPGPTPREDLVRFRRDLADHAKDPALAGLISLRDARRAVPSASLPDVFDYSVRRVLVFDRAETFLLFAHNGFHRKIEVALIAHPNFPAHVAHRLEKQLEAGLRTAFYTLHDAGARGAKLRGRVKRSLAAHGKPRIADAGMTFAQAFRLGVPVRRRELSGKVTLAEHFDSEEALFLRSGSYAHLEEMRPLDLLKFAYTRISRGAEELGFG